MADPSRQGPIRRVLFVDHETRLSGGELDLVDLVRGLREHEGGTSTGEALELHVVLPANGPLADALRLNGVTVHYVPIDASLLRVSRWDLARHPSTVLRCAAATARSAVQLDRLVADLRPDVIHSNSMKAHLLIAPTAWRHRIKHIWHVRDILEAGWLRRAVGMLAGLEAARVVCISRAVAASYATGRVATKVRVVHNGVRPQPVTTTAVRQWRDRLGASNDDVLIGIVGQIAWWKGQDVFIDAAAVLARQCPRARFAIVGSCLFPANEAAFEADLHRRASVRELDGKLMFTGTVEPIEPVMGALDILVHASRLPEPFGRVVVEAMAQGTPVVSTSIGAGPELVSHEAGLLVAPDDPASLVEALVELLDDANRCARSAAAPAVAQRFDIATTARGVRSVYDELLAS